MTGSGLSLAATDQDAATQLSAHERRVRGLSNWVRDFPVGPGPLKEWEQAQLFGMLPNTAEKVALRLFDELGDQLLIMGGHDQRDVVYRDASGRFDSLVEDAVSGDEAGAVVEPDEVQHGGIGAPQAHWLGLVDRGLCISSVPQYHGPGQPRIAFSIASEGRILTHAEARELSTTLLSAIAWTGR